MIQAFQKKAVIVRAERFAADIVRFTFHAPDIARVARPGQFVMVLSGPGSDPLLRRPFSIHRLSGDGNLSILFKVLGKGTRRLALLGEGDELDLVGPLGRGFRFEGVGPACLVGGGMGIAPMHFLLAEMLREKAASAPRVLLGARIAAELDFLAAEMEALGVQVTVATDDGSLGHHGTVVDLMHRLEEKKPWTVFTCGPHPMMRAVVGYCGRAGWRCQVSLETMMACGLAACLGCAVSRPEGGYLHVCKDGPVFAAEEVAWL